MAQTTVAATTTDTQLISRLSTLEQKIASMLGLKVFDYLFLFDKEPTPEVKITSVNPATQILLQEYVQTATSLLSELGVTRTSKTTNISDLFLETLHDIYIVRYQQALTEYADYALVRIPTEVEQNLLDNVATKVKGYSNPVTLTLSIPDAFVIDEQTGELLFDETEQAEKQDNQIKSYLSAFPEVMDLKESLLSNIKDITIKGIVPVFYRDQLLDLNEVVVQHCLLYFTKRVYEYIERGMSPLEAKANVQDYYGKITNNLETKFPPQLEELEDDLVLLITDALLKLPALYPETRTVILEDYKDIILFLIGGGDFLPTNYYELEFKPPEKFVKFQLKYNYIIDSYLIYDNGQMLPFPIESYNVDFTEEAKVSIFNAVTNGIVNPNFTLDAFLSPV